MFWYHESGRGFPEVDGQDAKIDVLSAAARTRGSSDARSAFTWSRSAGVNAALSFFHAAAMNCIAATLASLPESASERVYVASTAGTSRARARALRFPMTVARA